MRRSLPLIALVSLAAACTTEPTVPASLNPSGSGASLDLSAAPGDLVIDNFMSGGGVLQACGNAAWKYTEDASIIGGARELYVRDAGSCFRGPTSHAQIRIDATLGTATWGGNNTYSSEQSMRYGSEIGWAFKFNNSPNAGRGVPLNLSLTPAHKIIVRLADITGTERPGVTIRLRSGSALYDYGFVPSSGTNLIPVSAFNIPAAAAADIDGISLFGFGFKNPGYVFTLLAIQGGDDTPPEITPTVTGTLGANGWYTSDVDVSWTVSDPDSPVGSTAGCDAASVTADTDGQTFTCTATSAGGSTTQSVTVKRDASAPTVTYTGNAGSYGVDQAVAITCAASDATNPGSGLASSTCQNISGAAYTFSIGTNSYSASATDNAGQSATRAVQFTVSVTGEGLCGLVKQWVSQSGVAHSMCRQLENGAAGAFRNHVRAQTGKTVGAQNAAILIDLSSRL